MKTVLALGGALVLAGCVAGDRVTLLDPVQADKRAICDGLASGEIVPVIDAETGQQSPVCERGAVVVLDDEAAELEQEEYETRLAAQTDREVLRERNQQALLRERGPRVRTLDDTPRDAGLLGDLPLEVANESFGFASGANQLEQEVLGELVSFLSANIDRYKARYVDNPNYDGDPPGLQIDIGGYTDATNFNCADFPGDTTACNQQLSENRAIFVYRQLEDVLETNGLEINMLEEVTWFGAGDLAALQASKTACEKDLPEGESAEVCQDIERFRIADDSYRVVWVTFR